MKTVSFMMSVKSLSPSLMSLRKNDSISPRMGKLTNKLRSESQEALEKKMKTQKRVTKAARSSMPKVNFCTPKKTGLRDAHMNEQQV